MGDNPLASVWAKLKDSLPARAATSFLQAAQMPPEQAQGQVRSVLGGVAQGLLDAAKLPGDVYQGNVSMLDQYGRTNPEVIGRSVDLAGLVMGGGMPMAERGALGMSGGKLRLPYSDSLATPHAPTASDMTRASRVENVPISQARGTQPKMDWKKFEAGEHPPPLLKDYADLPVAVRREDGEYLIFDGHHRTVRAMNEGANSMPMHVIDAKDYAPQFAGRKPQPSKIDDDELLRELLGK
jgi:hypothetical protein